MPQDHHVILFFVILRVAETPEEEAGLVTPRRSVLRRCSSKTPSLESTPRVSFESTGIVPPKGGGKSMHKGKSKDAILAMLAIKGKGGGKNEKGSGKGFVKGAPDGAQPESSKSKKRAEMEDQEEETKEQNDKQKKPKKSPKKSPKVDEEPEKPKKKKQPRHAAEQTREDELETQPIKRKNALKPDEEDDENEEATPEAPKRSKTNSPKANKEKEVNDDDNTVLYPVCPKARRKLKSEEASGGEDTMKQTKLHDLKHVVKTARTCAFAQAPLAKGSKLTHQTTINDWLVQAEPIADKSMGKKEKGKSKKGTGEEAKPKGKGKGKAGKGDSKNAKSDGGT